jgi:hypothetical protein
MFVGLRSTECYAASCANSYRPSFGRSTSGTTNAVSPCSSSVSFSASVTLGRGQPATVRNSTRVGLLTQSGSGCWVAFAWLLPGCLRQINPALRGRFGAVANRAMEQERLAKVDEARAKADWHTKVALEEGLGRTIAWYREHRDS